MTVGALDHIVISPDDASIVAGTSQAYTAEAFDAGDNSLGDKTAETTFGIDAGAGGSWTANVYTSATAGVDWLVTGTYNTKSDTATLTVTVGVAIKLLWVDQPATPVAAGATWTAFTIEITDQYGNRTADTDIITIAASGTGNLTGNTVAAINGLATFDNFTYDKVESITISGSSGTLTPTAASSSVSVTVGLKNKLLWVDQPATPVAAGATWTAFTIEITDQYGNRTADTDIITIAASGTGNLTGNTVAAINGLATFDNFTYDKVESITISGSSGTLTPTAASSSVSVTAGALDHFEFASIADQVEDIPFNITIYAKDAGGNTVTGYTGTGNLLSDTYDTITPTSTTAFIAGELTDYEVTITKKNVNPNIITIEEVDTGETGTSNAFMVTK